MKKNAFKINGQNIKQTIGIQVTFITEKKLQIENVCEKFECLFVDCFFANLCVHFERLLEWESAYVCHHLRTEKEGI